MRKITQAVIVLLLALVVSTTFVFASEVPFEVVKTKVIAETTVLTGSEGVVIDGKLQDDASWNMQEQGVDTRVKIPVDDINYKLEFWNVGKMGGEKGFIFKSSYEKAKLTITYETGQAHKMRKTDQKFLDVASYEDVEVSTPDFKDTFTYDLWFTGGPYGKFFYKNKKGENIFVASVNGGEYISFNTLPEKLYLVYPYEVEIKITNSSAFEKWMEILGQTGCGPDSLPLKDSGIRFNDYDGEVMVRPDCDEDAWYGAELDMILHVDDHIKTGDDSTAALGLPEMTTFKMKPESEIVLAERKQISSIRVIGGKIWANVKRLVKDGTMDVEMSQAVAGIKGTTFIVEETGDTSTLKVIEGHVEFTSKATGKKEMIGMGEMMTATKNGLGKKITFDTEKEQKDWNAIKDKNIKKEKVTSNSKESNDKTLIGFLLVFLFFVGGFFVIKRQKK